jgi:hypothetical protein
MREDDPNAIDLGERMASDGVNIGGVGLGGILVIVGILVWLVFSQLILGIIIAVVGLVAFGGFVKGKWY